MRGKEKDQAFLFHGFDSQHEVWYRSRRYGQRSAYNGAPRGRGYKVVCAAPGITYQIASSTHCWRFTWV